jgi:hypothetical protein
MKRKTAIGSEERNPGHAPDIREVRKPGILRLIGALMRRGFEGSSQATLGLQSSHADTRSRIFVLETCGGNQTTGRLDHRARLG